MADEGDDDEFDSDDSVSPSERSVDVGDEERKRVEETAEKGHQAGDDSAEDRVAAAGEGSVVGEALGEGHGDSGAYGGGEADEQGGVRVVGREGGGEDGGERGDGAVHEAREAGLHDAQDEVFVVVDDVVELGQVGDVF